ncbi:MAG: hypothetical protein QNL78_01195 [Actinomycetes bacterium]
MPKHNHDVVSQDPMTLMVNQDCQSAGAREQYRHPVWVSFIW